ncbi:MAG: hypothetical protein IKG82_02555, partial [Oscillospiraceae bacterium]|nr:hypothetical protein [Oscillospiraceae bacterium]
MKRKFIALAGALLLTVCPLTGCGSTGSNNDLNLTEDEMPYGSTLVKVGELAVPVQYDRRFLEDALVEKLAAYYHALQEKDSEAFSALMFPLYHNYELETVYEGKYTDADVVNNTHEAICESVGRDVRTGATLALSIIMNRGAFCFN